MILSKQGCKVSRRYLAQIGSVKSKRTEKSKDEVY